MEVEMYLASPQEAYGEEMEVVWAEEVIEEDGSLVERTVYGSWSSRDEEVDSGSSAELTEEDDDILDESLLLLENLESGHLDWKLDTEEISDGETVAEKAQALLDHLDEIGKQESFPDWAEEKAELPLLEQLGSLGQLVGGYGEVRMVAPYQVRAVPGLVNPPVALMAPNFTHMSPGIARLVSPTVRTEVIRPETLPTIIGAETVLPDQPPLTPDLIREFEKVLHHTLTPPHTPPTYLDLVNTQEEETKDNVLEEDLDALINSQVASLYEEKVCQKGWESPVATKGNLITENAEMGQMDWGSAGTPPSDDSVSLSSSESDPDWSPRPMSVGRPSSSRGRKGAITTQEERKQRKKEQNKNAATRYRLKKKSEHANILGEENELIEFNSSLKEKVTELQREIKYLKSLMRDVCKAKGLIP